MATRREKPLASLDTESVLPLHQSGTCIYRGNIIADKEFIRIDDYSPYLAQDKVDFYERCRLYAIIDAHGHPTIGSFIKLALPIVLAQSLSHALFPGEITQNFVLKAMLQAFTQLDRDFCIDNPASDEGCSVVAVFVCGDGMFVASCGDSQVCD
ncbi:hypothetical protein SARC_17727 [Sphaeroforma arctica JP610]|uniref:PPM-type phosphatase domain-containing protein n=1 Tax=Sphaeroforma arctica JP610 TaxID=667725 RepID=A0A0L0EZC6_9EUKA|nr:hypothetical protein SARC_17727 [Sphaeroforma arctica JP610]KNC69756.1 hypothetical protein SARC_17727 [Sphaeroforma arctica JP610]|eukprot:XP_014143658.1 hypothetical protein SARC_17727 [Sphaeroforma arctica JP610]